MSVLENGTRDPRPEQRQRRGIGPKTRRPRRKRSYKAAADRRAEILDCALAAFAEKGYHQASIADVCERAAIGRATLYQYFDDKRDLLAALAEQITSRIVAAFERRPHLRIPEGFVPNEEQAIGFMEARFRTVLEVVFENADTARLVLRAGRGADGVVDAMLQKIDRAMLERIEADLKLAVETGAIRPIDIGFVARFFMGGIEKIVVSCLEENRPFDVAAIAREAAQLEATGILLRR